jgi:hypothetical protein
MRILPLLALLALAAAAAPAMADITIEGSPVDACINAACTPCIDPVTVPAPVNLDVGQPCAH